MDTKIQRNYLDRLFNFIFGREEHKDWTLSLYNAVNGSHYTDPDLIEFNTVEDMLYMGMQNDTSFLISDIMSVYEHQSSYNPNMPLRMLGYSDELYSGYVTKHRLNKYGSAQLQLPVPRLVVFYNGEEDTEDEVILKLSDSFPEGLRSESDIEIRVRMLNINYGRNKELLEACRPLSEYAWFIREIREHRGTYGIETAVDMTLDAMPEDFGIKEFLLIHKAEVCRMLARDYSEEEIRELFMEDGRREERKNTEAERRRADAAETRADAAETRADAAETRADAAEAEIRQLKEELAGLKAQLA